jgi:exosome complex component RRP4
MTLVCDVDANMKVELTLNDQRLRPIKEGRMIEVTPSKVPRFIGRSGSMIAMLKNETKCNIFIGQNGRIWITGRDNEMELAIKSLFKIERETHISGLTDRVTKFLKEQNIEEDKEKKESEGILDELLGNEK